MLPEFKKLYELTYKISKLEPWEWLYDIDLFAIQPDGYLEPFFVSIMGHEGNCYGIGVYYGLEGYADFDALAQEESGLPVSYLMSDIDCFTCYFAKEEELDDDSLWMFDELEIEPAEGRYFYFLKFEPRYYPISISADDARILCDVYEGLYFALKEWMNEHTVDPNWEKDEIIFAYQDSEWKLKVVQKPNDTRYYDSFIIDDEYLKTLQEKERTDTSLSMELMYCNSPVVDEEQDEEGRPLNPLMFIVLNNETGVFLETEFLKLDDDETDHCVDWLSDYIEANGIPLDIHCHNPYIINAIADICTRLNIEIVADDLTELQEYVEQVIEESI